MEVLDKIISLLKQNTHTQKELTDYLGLEKSTFSSWKSGKSQSYTRYIPQIAAFFEISSDALTSDSVAFDIEPHALSDTSPICCPICNCETTNFRRTRSVDFNNEKSSGLALEFFCEDGHTFYLLIESYKGNTYTVLTDENCKALKTLHYDIENAPASLESLFAEELNKKYRTLDGYGKEAVDSILDIEYERCSVIGEKKETGNKFEIIFSELPVSAGTGDFLSDEMTSIIEIPDTPFNRTADYVVQVNGDSMEPEYENDDYLLVRKQPQVYEGEIGIFVLNGEGFVKKYGGDRLISLNKKYPDIVLHEYDRIDCFGKVIGKI